MHGTGDGPSTGKHLGKLLRKGKVTAVGFINDQRGVMFMTQCGQACMTDHKCSQSSQRSLGVQTGMPCGVTRPKQAQTCNVTADPIVAG